MRAVISDGKMRIRNFEMDVLLPFYISSEFVSEGVAALNVTDK